MSASQPANFNLQEFSDAGLLLYGGRLYTYAYGTTAQKTAYTDAAGVVPHTYTADGAGGQYIALDARGELPAPLYLATGDYDLSLKRADGSTVWTRRANPSGDGVAALALPTGAGMVGANAYQTQDEVNIEQASVKRFGAVGDGVAIDQVAVVAAVAEAFARSASLYWPDGTYLTTATIPNFHDVRHTGPGVVKRGTDLFYVEPRGVQANALYIGTTGINTNDGLSSSEQRLTFQSAFDALGNYGPMLDGVWTDVAAAGTYVMSTGQQTHSTPSKNRVVIRGPAAGHPNVPTCIVDGGGNTAGYLHGINCDGIGVRVQVQDIKFQNFTQASGNARVGLVAANGADLYTVNVHSFACSWTGVMAKECEQVRCSGGILDANNVGAYGFISDSSHTSFGYGSASTADGPIIRKAISAGVYWSTGSQGHCDYVTFEDNGVGFLGAENSRCDTVGNNYKRNTVAKRMQTGGFCASGSASEVFNDGTADANTANTEYKAYSGDSSELDDQGSGSWQRVAFDRANHALAGVAPTTLSSPYTIAANRLQGVGKACRVQVLGVFTQATVGSAMTVNFGGMAFTVPVPAAATNVAFELDVTLYEVAGGYRAIGKLSQGLSASRFATATAGFVASSAQAITISATLANAADALNIYRTEVYLIG